MDDKDKKAIGLGLGALALLGLGIGLARKAGDTPAPNPIPPGPLPPVTDTLPLNVYYMATLRDGVLQPSSPSFGVKPGWITYKGSLLLHNQTTQEWEVDGISLGYQLGHNTATCPDCGDIKGGPGWTGYYIDNRTGLQVDSPSGLTSNFTYYYVCGNCGGVFTNKQLVDVRFPDYSKPILPTVGLTGFSTIKVTVSDGVRTASETYTPSDFTIDYGKIPNNVGSNAHAYGPGKLAGVRVYNNIGLTPEYEFVSFKKAQYPDAKWPPDPDALGGFMIYGYGTGDLDYNIWNWTVLTLLEKYWRPMQSGETVRVFTRAGAAAVDKAMNDFITMAALVLSQTFAYGASILWDRAAQGDGSLENPWVYVDGWKGEGYYLGAPGSFYGTAIYISEDFT
ncbi:MAG: hypothetical protein MIO92_13540 [Methanosarcinaceae archaeon]|nr:hypothetical protein [Methanosarcinaceae archaeon]